MGSRSRRTYHARLIPVWDAWVVEVPDAQGVHCLVVDLRDAESAARDAIATILGIDPDGIRVVLRAG